MMSIKRSAAVASACVISITFGVRNSSLLLMYWAQQAVPRKPAMYFLSLFIKMSTTCSSVLLSSAKKLFSIYLSSVGNNCTLLLNVPPTNKGVIHKKDAKVLEKLGNMISGITEKPISKYHPGMLSDDCGYLEYSFDSVKKLRYIVIEEDISFSQRVEAFDVYVKRADGEYKFLSSHTVIGAKKILQLDTKCGGVCIVIRQSRSNPVIKSIGFYE